MKMNYKYKKAVRYFQTGDLKASLYVAQKSLKTTRGEEQIKFLNLIGIIYHQLGLYNQAVNAFKKSLEIDDQNFQSWENLGIIYRRLNNFEKAENCFLRALELNPASDEVLTSLGVVYLFIDEVGKAIKCFERSIKINSKWSFTYGNLALAYALDNHFEEAEESLKKAIYLGFPNHQEIQARIRNLKAFAGNPGDLEPAKEYDEGDIVLN